MRRTIISMVFLAVAAVANGDAPFHARGAFFALSVPDVAASAKWYREKLGLEVTMTAHAENVAVTILEGNGLIVELIQRDDAKPRTGEAYRTHGLFKAGVIVDDFERTVAALKARGVEIHLGPFPAKDKQRANVIVKDNAGNLIQFFGR